MWKILRVGWIKYINTLPFEYDLTGIKPSFNIKKIYGYPSEMNNLLREGKVDISPISSAEYLENAEKYLVFPNLSISAKNKVISVALFSDIPLNKVKYVYLSTQSKTSRLLTKVILKKFFSMNVEYLDLKDISQVKNSAVLLIGDDAIKYLNRFKYFYDLAEIWFKKTGLPFVFALWSVRKDSFYQKRREILEFYNIILKSKNIFFSDIDKYLNKLNLNFNKEFLKEYLLNLDYSLTDKHIKSLELFNEYLIDIGIFQNKNKLKFINLNF